MQLSRSLITAAVLSFTLSAGFAASVPAMGNPGSDGVDPAGGIHGAAMSLSGVRRQGIADGIDSGPVASGAGVGGGSGINQGLAPLGAGAVDAAGQVVATAGCKDDNDWSVGCVFSDCLCTVLTIIISTDGEACNKCVICFDINIVLLMV